jgi:hypothetical protein
MTDLNEQPEGDSVAADVEKHTGEQDPTVKAPVYPTTKVTRRKPMGIKLVPAPEGLRADLSPSQVGALYWAADVMQQIYEHATDGSQHIAEDAGDRIDRLLVLYPITWTDPKPKKAQTPESPECGPSNIDLAT